MKEGNTLNLSCGIVDETSEYGIFQTNKNTLVALNRSLFRLKIANFYQETTATEARPIGRGFSRFLGEHLAVLKPRLWKLRLFF